MKKLLIGILIIVLLYAMGGLIYFFIHKKTPLPEEKPIADIKGYPYHLKANATELMKNEFHLLKDNLEGKEIDDEAYAESVAKLFIIDLYTITNKLNKYDVGGVQYVVPAILDNFKLNVKDTIYKYVEDNSDDKRVQTLPEVSQINTTSIEAAEYTIDENTYQGYKISLEWSYVKDLGYDETGELRVVKIDQYYYVAEKK